MIREDLFGAWQLARFEITYADGRPATFPFGEDAVGQLIYAPSGHMSAVLSRRHRAPLTATRLETATTAPAAEKAAAFDSYLSYGGTWALDDTSDETTVIHHVTHALSPALVGEDNRRRATLDGHALTLSYSLTAASGVERTYALRWVRA